MEINNNHPVIKFGKTISIIREIDIRSIKRIIEGGYNPQSLDYFIKGDNVEVIEGPLKGILGEVIRLDNEDRLIIRVEAVQHTISIQINKGFLKILY